MKVKELIEMFTEEDMEKEVYVSKDAEGNDFSKFTDASDQICIDRGNGDIEIYSEDEPEEYEGEKVEKVIVLWRV